MHEPLHKYPLYFLQGGGRNHVEPRGSILQLALAAENCDSLEILPHYCTYRGVSGDFGVIAGVSHRLLSLVAALLSARLGLFATIPHSSTSTWISVVRIWDAVVTPFARLGAIGPACQGDGGWTIKPGGLP